MTHTIHDEHTHVPAKAAATSPSRTAITPTTYTTATFIASMKATGTSAKHPSTPFTRPTNTSTARAAGTSLFPMATTWTTCMMVTATRHMTATGIATKSYPDSVY